MYYSALILKAILVAMYFNYLIAYRTRGADEKELKHSPRDTLTTLCQTESENVRNAFKNMINYQTDDQITDDLIDIWLKNCIHQRRGLHKRPYYG
uniref:Hypotheticial protein n=1 Tax=Schistosoma japonicum TaxID=6182 RepID=C1LFD9_SCHJA|nr:hypotheticial protein [Schistosoma japonicum]